MADAAIVAGEARYIKAFGLPILPLKFLFAVEMTTSLSAGTPLCVPTHGPHPGPTTVQPAFTKAEINPDFTACRYISREAGAMMNLTSGLTRLPFIILAAASKSSSRPFVHVPRYAWSIL